MPRTPNSNEVQGPNRAARRARVPEGHRQAVPRCHPGRQAVISSMPASRVRQDARRTMERLEGRVKDDVRFCVHAECHARKGSTAQCSAPTSPSRSPSTKWTTFQVTVKEQGPVRVVMAEPCSIATCSTILMHKCNQIICADQTSNFSPQKRDPAVTQSTG